MCKHGTDVLMNFYCDLHQVIETKTIDSCIAPLVVKLNSEGIRTTNSCCGHGQYQGSIIIEEDSIDRAYDLGYPIVHEVLGGGDYVGYAILT